MGTKVKKVVKAPKKQTRVFTAEGRKRIAEAQRRRWRKYRKEQKAAKAKA